MKNKRISFLPIWGKQNETIPIQQMRALRKLGAEAEYGLPGSVFPLSRTCMAQRPDIISLDWIHQYCLSPGLAASLIKSFLFLLDVLAARYVFRTKLVWTLHNLRHHDPRPRKTEQWISRFFASNCIKVRILGEGMEEEICSYLGVAKSKLVVIPEGPYAGWYPEGISTDDARKMLQIPEGNRVWLYLGNLRPYKGVEELIAAYLKLQPEHTDLIIAGRPWNTEYADFIAEMASGHQGIRLAMKLIPDAELQVYFAASDLVVLPFKNVLNSGSALLAMGFSKALVAPSIGLLPFRLRTQKQFLYAPEAGLESALRVAMNLSRNDLHAIGQANRREALQYSWEDFANFLIHV